MSVNEETTYRVAVDVWKAQVDSYWTRASYNVVFQLALLTGFLKLTELHCRGLIILLSSIALILTVVWFKTSERMNDYIRHYWDTLRRLEAELSIPENRWIFSTVYAGIGERKIKGNNILNAQDISADSAFFLDCDLHRCRIGNVQVHLWDSLSRNKNGPSVSCQKRLYNQFDQA